MINSELEVYQEATQPLSVKRRRGYERGIVAGGAAVTAGNAEPITASPGPTGPRGGGGRGGTGSG